MTGKSAVDLNTLLKANIGELRALAGPYGSLSHVKWDGDPGDPCWVTGRFMMDCALYSEARPWLEYAAIAANNGKFRERADYETLLTRLIMLGRCHLRLGEITEAYGSFERASVTAQRGDTQGTVEPPEAALFPRTVEAIGTTLEQLCGPEQAQSWYEQAADAVENDPDKRLRYPRFPAAMTIRAGDCLESLVDFGRARLRFERAVACAENSGSYGLAYEAAFRLAANLSKQDKPVEACAWFERAAAHAERTDRVAHTWEERLGPRLRQIGLHFASRGEHAEALSWLARSVTATEREDDRGRVDYWALSITLDDLGDCLAKLGRQPEAQRCTERASAMRKKNVDLIRLAPRLWVSPSLATRSPAR